MKCSHCATADAVTVLVDDTGNHYAMCAPCAGQPWPMYEVSEDPAVVAEALKVLAAQARLAELRTALALQPPDTLRALVEQFFTENAALVEQVGQLEETNASLMTALEESVSTTDSLSSQLVDTRARLNVHKKEYPRMFYHRDGKTAVAQDAKAGMALRRTGLWFDHPDKAEAARQRVYNLKKPEDTVINDKPDGALAAMTPEERAKGIGTLLKQDAAHKPAIDDSRIDVTIEQLDRMKIPGKVQ